MTSLLGNYGLKKRHFYQIPHIYLFVWGLTALALALIVLVAYLNPLDGVPGQGFGRFLGRFHPLLLHFPVACLSIVGLLELARLSERTAYLSRFSGPVILFAAVSACITVVLGLLLAANEGHTGALVDRHRSRGIGVAVLSCVAAALYFCAQYKKPDATRSERRPMSRWLSIGYKVSVFAAIGTMGLAAHDGGSLVHGPTYLADHSPPMLAPMLKAHLPDSERQNRSHRASLDESDLSSISADLRGHFDDDVGSFINAYCIRCHGPGKQEANLRLDQFDPTFKTFSSQHDWQRVLGALGSHRMPPAEAKQPTGQQRAQAMNWVQSALEEYAYARRAERANAPLRRLNKRELNTTYQDLFQVDAEFVASLPEDPKSEHGYDNDADLLMVSMSDLKAYLGVARQAVKRYVSFIPKETSFKPQGVDKYFVELEDIYHFGRMEGDDLSYERAPGPLSAEAIAEIIQKRRQQAPVYRDRKYGPLPHGFIPTGDVRGVGEGRGFARLHEQFLLLKTQHAVGEVVVRVHTAMTPGKSGDVSVPRLRLEAGWRKIQSLRVKVIGEHDVTAPLSAPQVLEYRFRLEDVIAPETARRDQEGQDRWVLLVLSNAARHEHGKLAGSIYGQVDPDLPSYATLDSPYIRQAESAAEYQKEGLKHWESKGVPYLYLDALEAEIIPVAASAHSPWRVNMPKDGAPLEQELEGLSAVLKRYLPRVFRRSVNQQDIATYTALFKSLRARGDGYKTAIQETLSAALISPEFLYIGKARGEPKARFDKGLKKNAALDELDENRYLASRLSYFLWSTMPDEPLLERAESGALSDPYVLANEVERMLNDTRAKRFTRAFAEQWLMLDKLNDVSVSYERYPDYGPEFAALTAEQSIAHFQDNFHNERDARALYSSEYMLLNDQLAHHYNLPDQVGGELRRVKTEASDQRIGLLTHASVLTMNSDGHDSHPIKRGVWMLERVLDSPPPPPPPAVPDLDPNNPLLAGLTLKQKIEHHRKLSACSGCHEQIDPWGILMENFDATGRWRDQFEVDGKSVAVDSSSVLPSGKEIRSVASFSKFLHGEKQEQLMKALVKHMMVYALGRELDILDEQEAEHIFSAFRASGYRLTELTKSIVQSDAFTNRTYSTASVLSAAN